MIADKATDAPVFAIVHRLINAEPEHAFITGGNRFDDGSGGEYRVYSAGNDRVRYEITAATREDGTFTITIHGETQP
jgi:hypothetical protein